MTNDTASHQFGGDTLAALETIAATPVLLVALDFDGTLSPLHDQPMAARATPGGAAAVAALAALPDTIVALVSGRSISDLRIIAEHDDDSPVYLAGSHGAEVRLPEAVADQAEQTHASAQDASADEALRDELYAAAVAGWEHLPGVWIEPKRFGFGVHVRLASPSDAAATMSGTDALVAERAPTWRRRTGHNIVEYSFRHEGKDSALAALREQTGATAVFFAGDDVTDEDAMRTLGEGDLGVRVGDGDTAARVRVADPKELAALLSVMAQMRAAAQP